MIVDDILDAAVTCVEALTVTTDAGAPSAFHEVDFGDLDDSAEDRGFAVYLAPGEQHQLRNVTTATGGTGDYMVRFVVEAKFINEGRSVRAFDALVAQDQRRIMDRLRVYIPENVSGAHVCIHEETSIARDAAEPSILYSSQTFRVEYVDDVVTA